MKNNLPKYSLYSKGNFQKKDQIKGPKCGQSGTGNEDKCSIGLLWKKFTTLRYQNVFVSQSKVNSYAIFIDKIRVNCLCPGVVETPMVKQRIDSGQATRDYLENVQPMGRMGKPEEIAALALYLCGPESGWTTGAIISIDGGQTAA